MRYRHILHGRTYTFHGLVDVLAKATSLRSGDVLAGCAAESDAERAAARWVLADLPLTTFLDEHVVPPDDDDVTRLILDSHDAGAFAAVKHLTVGGFREWLLEVAASAGAAAQLSAVAPGLTPEMVAAVSKLMRNQDLIAVGAATEVVTAFRTTLVSPAGSPLEPSTRGVTLKLPAGAALDFDDKVDEVADLLLAH